MNYLRKLDLARSQDKLNALAYEVGLNLQSEQQLPLADIQGYILTSYRDFKTRFEKLLDNLTEQKTQAVCLHRQLADAPASYPYQEDIAELPKLINKLQLIEEAIED